MNTPYYGVLYIVFEQAFYITNDVALCRLSLHHKINTHLRLFCGILLSELTEYYRLGLGLLLAMHSSLSIRPGPPSFQNVEFHESFQSSFSGVSFVEVEQVNVCWEVMLKNLPFLPAD